MAANNYYLEKHAVYPRLINEPVAEHTFLIVVIPCYNEPGLLKTWQSLLDCNPAVHPVEIITVINSGEHDNDLVLQQNKDTMNDAVEWKERNKRQCDNRNLRFHVVEIKNLPKKHAGVGMARKAGMDEAVRRFTDIKRDDGVIVCLDADCTVDKNYFIEIEKHFLKHADATGCSIYFEHPLEGVEFEKEIYEGIINYELFLRYYKCALLYCNFPYAFHTIGSCMAVRNKIYQKQGGMNRRKAGEDFYFLHKVFPLVNNSLAQSSFSELNSTRVIPSPRQSDRVPFGTGSAIQKFLKNDSVNNDFYPVYHIQSFSDLKSFFELVPCFYSASYLEVTEYIGRLSSSLQRFLMKNNFEQQLQEILDHCASEKMFVKRFYHWFNGFMVLRFVHFARDNFYEPMEITEATRQLSMLMGIPGIMQLTSKKELLNIYRKWERKMTV